MKKIFEFKLVLTIENDTISAEVMNLDEETVSTPAYEGPLDVSVDVSNYTSISTSNPYYESEETWYKNVGYTYKE